MENICHRCGKPASILETKTRKGAQVGESQWLCRSCAIDNVKSTAKGEMIFGGIFFTISLLIGIFKSMDDIPFLGMVVGAGFLIWGGIMFFFPGTKIKTR